MSPYFEYFHTAYAYCPSTFCGLCRVFT